MAHYLNMKTCRICNIEKSKSEFYKSSSTKDKLNIYCKKCDNEKRARYLKKKREAESLQPKPKATAKPKRKIIKREPLPQKKAIKPRSGQLDQNFLDEALRVNKKCRDNIKKQQRKSLLKIKQVVSAEFLRISKSRVGDKSSVSALVIINKKPVKYISEYIENSQADDLILSMNNSPVTVAENLLSNGALL